jgi:hypothetical protein
VQVHLALPLAADSARKLDRESEKVKKRKEEVNEEVKKRKERVWKLDRVQKERRKN